jgi:hypothetical protein
VQLTPITLPLKEARRRFTDAGLLLAQAGAVDPSADPLKIPVEVYENVARWHRRPEDVPAGYDPTRDWQEGRCCS